MSYNPTCLTYKIILNWAIAMHSTNYLRAINRLFIFKV
jgi:hypothetical protein